MLLRRRTYISLLILVRDFHTVIYPLMGLNEKKAVRAGYYWTADWSSRLLSGLALSQRGS